MGESEEGKKVAFIEESQVELSVFCVSSGRKREGEDVNVKYQ